MKWILTSQDAAAPALMGGKAAALAEIDSLGLPIPAWFVISPQAFDASLSEAQRNMLRASTDPKELQNLVAEIQPNGEIAAAIERAAAELSGAGGLLAVRSSAVDEDGADHSFAGQLESFLFVSAGQVVRRVADVWKSGFTDRVFRYRLEQGMEALPSPPAVLVQQMIDAAVSGVAFAADPVTGSRSTVVVSAVFGLGTALVGGDADCDTYRLRRDGTPLERKIAKKTLRHVADPSQPQGVRAESVGDPEAGRNAGSSAVAANCRTGACGKPVAPTAAGHRVGNPGLPVVFTPGQAHHSPRQFAGLRWRAGDLGQFEHRRKLQWHYHSPHVHLRPPRL